MVGWREVSKVSAVLEVHLKYISHLSYKVNHLGFVSFRFV